MSHVYQVIQDTRPRLERDTKCPLSRPGAVFVGTIEEGHDKVAPRPASYSTLAMSYVYQVTKYNIDM